MIFPLILFAAIFPSDTGRQCPKDPRGLSSFLRTLIVSIGNPEAQPPAGSLIFLLLQPHATQEVGEARVGAETIEPRVDFKMNHSCISFFISLFQQPECLVLFA
jgi:hypothetical protein